MDINLVWDPARGVNFQEYEGDKATAAKAAADNEKATARHVSNAGVPSNPDADLGEAERQAAEEAKEKAAERRLLRRLDWKLIPWLCILYLLAFLDRTNIGNAKIAGMNKDLELSDGQYNAALAIFFVSYSIFEPLTNILLKKHRPSIFIPVTMMLWGTCMTLMGFVYNWSGLMAGRWFLGLTEAGMFPGVNYYLSCWYRRDEFGLRAAIFFSAAALSGSFGGALAAGIQHMDGVGNLRGWSWIFIIEGLLTFVFGVASFWMVHDFPDEAGFLSDDDKQRLLRRLDGDQQASARREVFKTLYFWQAMRDWKTWMSMAIYMGCDMPLFAVTLFLPTIIDDLGLNTNTIQSQLWTVPPYAAAAVFTVFMGWLADKFKVRGICNVCVSMVGIAGFSMILAADSPKIKYIGTCLGVMGLYPCVSNTITWIANNTQGVYKRGVVLGFVIGWGNLSGILSSFTYRHPPLFIEGHAIVIAFMALCLCVGSLTMMALLSRENQKREQGKRNCWSDGKTQEEIHELGDNEPGFRYTV
ncbi:putative transporter [Colletotrichum siamense]|uniref:putative transporter n=1 Tax=Colletotrichum siamense TaxID=690259 RepID=UPI001872D8E5|nr:putative transporter [Colletotrichum siamense]KAF5515411.1 putative transporter [Colletotrichum siamense]